MKELKPIEYLSELRYKPMPTPPDEVIRYCKDKLKDPKHSLREDFWRKIQIMSWFKQHSKWVSEMLSNYEWLKHLKEKGEQVADQLHEYENKKEEWWAYGFDLIRELASHNLRYGGRNELNRTQEV